MATPTAGLRAPAVRAPRGCSLPHCRRSQLRRPRVLDGAARHVCRSARDALGGGPANPTPGGGDSSSGSSSSSGRSGGSSSGGGGSSGSGAAGQRQPAGAGPPAAAAAPPPPPPPPPPPAAAAPSGVPTPLERLLAAAVFLLPLSEGLWRVWLLALHQARDNAWQLCLWSSVQRNMLADAVAEGGARAERSQGDLQAAQVVATMSQRLVARIEEPLQEAAALATRPLLDAAALVPWLPAPLAGAAAALTAPATLCLLCLLAGVVVTAAAAARAAAAAVASDRDELWRRRQQQHDPPPAAGGLAAAAAAAAARPWAPPFQAPAFVAVACSAAVLLRISWSPLASALAAQGHAYVPGGVVATAVATYAQVASLLTWGTTALALGALLRLLLTAAPRAAAAEAAGAAAIAAACHRALLLADAVLAVASDLPSAAKLGAIGRFAAYALAVEALGAKTEEQRARLEAR